MTKRKKIWLGILCAVVVTAIYVGSRIIITVNNIPHAYAAWATADLIIFHMQNHSNQWPHSWNELLSNTNAFIAKHGGLKYGPAENLPNLVSVQWNAKPEDLAKCQDNRETRPFAVVSRKDGTPFKIVWEHGEPNQMILDYLKEEANKPKEASP